MYSEEWRLRRLILAVEHCFVRRCSLAFYPSYVTNFPYSCVRFASFFFFFSSRRRHTRFDCDWSSDVCSSDLFAMAIVPGWHATLFATKYGAKSVACQPGTIAIAKSQETTLCTDNTRGVA